MPPRGDRRVRDPELEEIEIGLLLEGVHRRYGHDFRDYDPSFVSERIRRRVREERLDGLPALLGRVLRDRECMDRLLRSLSAPPASLFEPPDFFRAFRKNVVPLLRTYPSVRLWQIGCAGGSEAFSLAILLEEEKLPGSFRIYVTEPSGMIPEEARRGAFPADRARECSARYARSGGKGALEDHCETSRGRIVFRASLRNRIVFAPHCLVTDGPFNEFQVVVCRNVQDAFNDALRARFHALVHGSLVRFGFLGLGRADGLGSSPHRECYTAVSAREGLYRKVRE